VSLVWLQPFCSRGAFCDDGRRSCARRLVMSIPALTNLIPGFVFSAVAIVVATTAVLLCSQKRSHIAVECAEKAASQSHTNADFERPAAYKSFR
jgi:hypothetical protein